MANRQTVVVGLGATGLACLRHLATRGVPLLAMDTRTHPPGLDAARAAAPEVHFHLGSLDTATLRAAERVIVSPGVALATPELAEVAAAGVEVMGDIELFAREATAPVVAITGSNGKSTVTAMVAALFRAAGVEVAVGGNFGTPAPELLDGPVPEAYVLELSSFQLEATHTLKPKVAALLNVSADHLDRYPDLEAYAAAKARIARGAGTLVVNRDDPRTAAMPAAGATVVGFTAGAPAPGDWGLVRDAQGELQLAHGREAVMAASELPLVGRHNQMNALAALAIGSAMGLPERAMVEGLRRFEPLPHRCCRVAQREGIDWVDDSKGTNVGATLAAVAGIEGPVVLIVGGEGKGQDFSPLWQLASEGGLRGVVAIGRDGPAIAGPMADHIPVVEAADMEDAVAAAASLARRGDTVLLSPACASFDMFRDYHERGERFAAAVTGEQP